MVVADAVAAADYALVTSLYPSDWGLTGAALKDRVRTYRDAGLRGVVVHHSSAYEGDVQLRQDPVATVIATPPRALPDVLREVQAARIPVVAHAPTAESLPHLHSLVPRLGVWLHELLAMDYRRLGCDYTSQELNAQRQSLDAGNAALRRAWGPVFADASVPVVFASEHQRRHAEFDIGTSPSNAHVIPHHTPTVAQLARVREPSDARSILLMTASDAPHAGGDIAVRALEILSSRQGFGDLSIFILGGGPAVGRSPLATMRNISVSTVQPGQAERAAASFDHGILLSPSRWNSHDPVLTGAMAQGMVAVTHPVGGTPEYLDGSCAVLARAGDPWAFADALWSLLEDPGLLPDMSHSAIRRIASQCGWPATIARDVELIERLTL